MPATLLLVLRAEGDLLHETQASRQRLVGCGFGLFLLFLGGQTVAGWKQYNEDRKDHGQPEIALSQYPGSAHWTEATFENWESEFLQMAAYVVLTAFLFQRGSAESKDPDKKAPQDEDPEEKRDDPNAPGPVRKGGLALRLYGQSLSFVFFVLFFLSFIGHALGGFNRHNEEQGFKGKPLDTFGNYIVSSELWFQSLQNWQSEFLAVGSLVVLSIYLRQKGSAESKPVAAPHSKTGTD